VAISLRSHVIASVAFVGAATIAFTPIAQPEVMPSLQRSSAAYQLSALANPITAIAGVVEFLNYQILSGLSLDSDPAAYVFADPYWTEFFTATNPFTDPPSTFRYGPQTSGLIPDLASGFSTNALSALISNLSNYGFAISEGALALGTGTAAAVWNTPAAVASAVGYLAAGDSAAALAELQTQIVAPLQASIQFATDAITYITSNLTRNVQTVLTATLPKLLGGLARATVGGLTFLTQSAIATITQVVTDLAGFNFEAAWNGAVNGFLSTEGTLGQLTWLTVAPIGFPNPADLTTGNPWVSPSLRNVITTVAVGTGSSAILNDALGLAGIRNEPFFPGPLPAASVPSRAKKAARSAASVRPAAAVPAVAVPAVAVPAVAIPAVEMASSDNGGVSAGPSATKPIKHRAARRAAAAG
jgi:hypothetical protein